RFSRDWSSNVCSSDLLFLVAVDDVERLEIVVDVDTEPRPRRLLELRRDVARPARQIPDVPDGRLDDEILTQEGSDRFCLGGCLRSEERRVGKEWRSWG